MARTAGALKAASAESRSAETVPFRPALDVETLVTRLAARPADVSLREPAEAVNGFVPPEGPKHFESAETPEWPEPAVPFAAADAARALLDAVGSDRQSDRTSDGKRPIVFAAPEPSTLEALAAATLQLDAAWALEPMAEAFVATARWVRPTILVAPPLALDALADVWDDSDQKWSRLRSVVLHIESGKPTLDRWRRVFGCRVAFWKDPR